MLSGWVWKEWKKVLLQICLGNSNSTISILTLFFPDLSLIEADFFVITLGAYVEGYSCCCCWRCCCIVIKANQAWGSVVWDSHLVNSKIAKKMEKTTKQMLNVSIFAWLAPDYHNIRVSACVHNVWLRQILLIAWIVSILYIVHYFIQIKFFSTSPKKTWKEHKISMVLYNHYIPTHTFMVKLTKSYTVGVVCRDAHKSGVQQIWAWQLVILAKHLDFWEGVPHHATNNVNSIISYLYQLNLIIPIIQHDLGSSFNRF